MIWAKFSLIFVPFQFLHKSFLLCVPVPYVFGKPVDGKGAKRKNQKFCNAKKKNQHIVENVPKCETDGVDNGEEMIELIIMNWLMR